MFTRELAHSFETGDFELDVYEERDAVHVASVLRALQATEIPERGIQLVLETDEALVVASSPLALLSRASNLVHEAIQLSRSGARLILRSRSGEAGVYIEVEDEFGSLFCGDPPALFPYWSRPHSEPAAETPTSHFAIRLR